MCGVFPWGKLNGEAKDGPGRAWPIQLSVGPPKVQGLIPLFYCACTLRITWLHDHTIERSKMTRRVLHQQSLTTFFSASGSGKSNLPS